MLVLYAPGGDPCGAGTYINTSIPNDNISAT
jgi:hypothetical protein